MKTIILFFLLGVSTLTTTGQPYKSIFSSDSTSWYVYECAGDAGGTIVYSAYPNLDTIINQKTYFKFFRENIYNPYQIVGLHEELCGYVQEDTLTGKYYFMKLIDGLYKEAIFMDLSLAVGDTFNVISDFRFMWTEPVIVDSISFNLGKKVISLSKLFYDCNSSYPIKFIEGIGALNGFYMGEWYEQPEPYSLMCKIENSDNVFSTVSDLSGDCYRDGGANVNENNLTNNIKVYPIPASKYLNIDITGDNINLEYTIYNSIGKEIQAGQFSSNSQKLKIDETGLFYLIITDEKFKVLKKVIINGY
jgi:hypothetical protein